MSIYNGESAFIYNQYLIQSGGIHPTFDQFYAFSQTYYQYKRSMYMIQPTVYIPIYPVSQPAPMICQTPEFIKPTIKTIETIPPMQDDSNEQCIIEVKPEEKYQQKIPNNFAFNKRYGLKNKDECNDGMSCKNVYCKYFHHPSADPTIFLQK